MTTMQFLFDWLENCGLFPDEAGKILEVAKQSPEHASMADRWDRPLPHPVIGVQLKISVGKIAYNWLTENEPEHYSLEIFEEYNKPASARNPE